jgi:predicted phosphodiesterase
MAKAKWAKWAAISCTHCPYQSERALKRLLQELRGCGDLTHFIHLGDVVDAEAASVHADDPSGHTLYDEFCVAADMLRRIREVLPKDCKLIQMDGNHDDNAKRADPRRIRYELRDLCDPRKMVGVQDEYKKWRSVPYRNGSSGCFVLGSVIFAHGYSASASSKNTEPIQLAMACHGKLVNQLVVRGHTHRPHDPVQCMRTARIKLPIFSANVGYMAFDERPSYTNRVDIQEWGRAVMFGECQLGRVGRMGRDSWSARLVNLD